MLCITDANIIIDLYEAGFLVQLFRLNDEWVSTDFILTEVQHPQARVVTELGLRVVGLSGEELAEVTMLAATYPRPSPQDLSALVWAKKNNAIVVSGDAGLRAAAEAEALEVHGVLWILDRLFDEGLVSATEAARGLRLMLAADARLPKLEVERRLKRWEGGS